MGDYDTSGYVHLLSYIEEQDRVQALSFIQATFDADAQVDETEEDGIAYHVIIFRTENAFSLDQRRALLRVTNPDEYDLNC